MRPTTETLTPSLTPQPVLVKGKLYRRIKDANEPWFRATYDGNLVLHIVGQI
jgi:hypothetical protein